MNTLRAEAERRFDPGTLPSSGTPHEPAGLVYELQIHQLELEMQNEALRAAQLAREHSLARYRELFELAPVGYLSLDEEARILEANVAAADLLAASPQEIVGRRLSLFVPEEHVLPFAQHRREVIHSGLSCTTDLELLPLHGPRRTVRLSSARGAATLWLATLLALEVGEQASGVVRRLQPSATMRSR